MPDLMKSDGQMPDSESKKFTDEDIVRHLQNEKSKAEYHSNNELSTQREEADRAYANELTGNVKPTTNMSRVLISVLNPTADTVTAHVSKAVMSDNETVVLNPMNKQLAPQAKSITRMCNYVLNNMNNGYDVISTMIKDGLLHKAGIVKTTWNEMDTPYIETYVNVDKDQLKVRIQARVKKYGGEGEIVDEKTEETEIQVVDPMSGQEINVTEKTTTCKVRYVHPKAMIPIVNVPPEEFLINEGATSINDDDLISFVGQRKVMYVDTIHKMFPEYSVKKIIEEAGQASGSGSLWTEYEKYNRHNFDGTFNQAFSGRTESEIRNLLSFEVTECWAKLPMDGMDKPNKLMHIFMVGKLILMKEEWFGPIPFQAYVPYPIPHKFYGLSLWDKVKHYHGAKTGIVRGFIDSINRNNTDRVVAKPGMLEIRNIRQGQPGAIKGGKQFNRDGVLQLPTNPPAPGTLEILQYLDKEITGQVGIDYVTGVVSSEIEKSGNSEQKMQMAIDNTSAKIEMLIRGLTENGLKDIFWTILMLLKENADHASIKKIVEMISPEDPDVLAILEDTGKESLTAMVGIGHKTKNQKISELMMISGQQDILAAASQVPMSPVSIIQRANLAKEIIKETGRENFEDYIPIDEAAMNAQMQMMQQMMQQATEQGIQQGMLQAAQNPELAKIQAEAMLKQAQTMKTQAETANLGEDNARADQKQQYDQMDGDRNFGLNAEKTAWEIKTEMEQERPVSFGN